MAIIDPRRLFIDASTHSGKANFDPSLYSEDGMPIPRQTIASTLDANGLPLKPLEMDTGADPGKSDFRMIEKFGVGVLNTKTVAKATPSVPRARKFMFPRITSIDKKEMLEIVYTEECDEILELIEDKMVEMAKTNRKPATMLLGKQQYRQYMAVISYQQQVPTVPKTIADATIVIMDQEHYFDIVPSVDDMITHKL